MIDEVGIITAKGCQLTVTHLFWMAFVMKKDETVNPGDATFFRPISESLHTQPILNLIEKFRLLPCHLTNHQRQWAVNPDTICYVSSKSYAYPGPQNSKIIGIYGWISEVNTKSWPTFPPFEAVRLILN